MQMKLNEVNGKLDEGKATFCYWSDAHLQCKSSCIVHR